MKWELWEDWLVIQLREKGLQNRLIAVRTPLV